MFLRIPPIRTYASDYLVISKEEILSNNGFFSFCIHVKIYVLQCLSVDFIHKNITRQFNPSYYYQVQLKLAKSNEYNVCSTSDSATEGLLLTALAVSGRVSISLVIPEGLQLIAESWARIDRSYLGKLFWES